MKPRWFSPLTLLFLCFFVSSCLFAYVRFPVRMGVVTASVLALTLLVTPLSERLPRLCDPSLRQNVLFILAGLTAAGLLSFVSWDLAVPYLESRAGRTEEAVIRISDCEYSAVYASRYRAEVMESACLPKGAGIVLNTELSGLTPGTLVSGEVTYGLLSELDSDFFDARRTYFPERIFLSAEGTLSVTGTKTDRSPAALFAALNSKMSSSFLALAGRDAGGFASALLLGNRDFLSASLSRDFRRLGLSHLLVVSGAHFSLLVASLASLMRRTKLHRKKRALISLAVIVFFMLLTGGSPSVVRAGIMHILIQLSVLFSRKPQSIHSFALSGTLLILWNPFSAVSCGLQLSYAATFACLVWIGYRGAFFRFLRLKTGYFRGRNRLTKLLSAPIETLMITGIVTLGTLPLIWLYFGEVPLLSLPANILFFPLITLYLRLCWIFVILLPLRVFSVPLALVLNAGYRAVSLLAGFVSRVPGALLSVNYPFAPFLLLPAAVCFLVLPFAGKKTGRRAAAVSAACIVLFFSAAGISRIASRKNVDFIHVTVKKNEGFLLCAENRILLCDMSDGSSGAVGKLRSEMKDLRACEIDTVLLTHYHNKHSQMLGRLFDRQIVRTVWLPEPGTEDEKRIARSLTELCAERGVETVFLPADIPADFCGVPVTVYERTLLKRSTHPISAVSVSAPSAEIFFASSSFNEGGLTERAEASDVVILGGHSPVYKKTFALSFRKEPKILALCADALAHADADWIASFGTLYPDCVLIALEEGNPLRLSDRKNGGETGIQ